MASKTWAAWAGVLGLGVVALMVPAPGEKARAQGVAEKGGQALDNVGRGLRQRIQHATARARASAHEQDLLARLYSRIHWDKALVGSTLELEVQDGGVALLRGAVPDAVAHQRAVILARDTVGVVTVVDELVVAAAPARVIQAAPATTTTTTTTIEVAPPATVIKP